MRRSLLFVGLAVLIATPVFAQSAAERQLAADIRILEQRTDRIEQALAELARTLEGLGKKLTDEANVTRKLSADQTVVIQEVMTAVGVLREQLAETNQRLTPMREASTASAGSRELFEHARADYMAGNYPLAVKGFTAYLDRAPQSSDRDSAQYYLGEAFRLDGKLNEALTAYDRLIAQHATSEQVPPARVRRAEVLSQLGRAKEARAEYELVVKESPNTDAAVLAKQRLATLAR